MRNAETRDEKTDGRIQKRARARVRAGDALEGERDRGRKYSERIVSHRVVSCRDAERHERHPEEGTKDSG